jgi:hypothetical protein
MTNEFGGYSADCFIEEVSESLKCGICLAILKDPRQCRNGHTYCISCATNFLLNKKKCPTCDVRIANLKMMSPNLVAKGIVDNLVVGCKLCSWTGPLFTSDEHQTVHSCLIAVPPVGDYEEEMDENANEQINVQQVGNHSAEVITLEDKVLHRLTKSKKSTYIGQVKLISRLNGSKEAKKHGFGVEFYGFGSGRCKASSIPLTQKYSGEFQDNKRCGHGTIHNELNNKLMFSGEWLKDKKHGLGTSYDLNGNIEHCGNWKKGRREN